MDNAIISRNTLDHLSLHDCRCRRLYFQEDRLILEMDWMEVLASHPRNPYPTAHQSGPGVIELLSPKLVRLEMHPTAAVPLEEMDFRDLEILTFLETPLEDGFQANLYALFLQAKECDSIDCTIQYSESKVRWKELGDTSWFEGEAWK